MTKKFFAEKNSNHDSSSAIRVHTGRRVMSFNLIFILAFIFIIFFCFFSYRQINNLISANTWVIHTYKVIQATDDILFYIVDSETLQRGFIISGNKRLLNEREDSISSTRKNLKNLENLTQDSPSQNAKVLQLATLVEERFYIANQTIHMKETNSLNTPEGMVIFNQGQVVSDHIRYLGEEIKSVELMLLNERNREVLVRATSANVILILGNVISLGFLLTALILFNRELKKRIISEEERINTEYRFRSILESAHDMIAAIDKEYRFIIFNEAYQKEFKRLFGVSIKLGMSVDDAMEKVPEAKTKLLAVWKDSLGGKEDTKNIELTHDKEKNVYEITSNTVVNQEGNLIGVIQIVRNITKRIQEQAALNEDYEKLQQVMAELQTKNQQITTLVEMSDNMLACASQEEFSTVVTKYCQRMLDFANGFLYVMHPSRNYLEIMASWGNPNEQDHIFAPEQCWAIRRGRLHQVSASHEELICHHIREAENNRSFICIPLMAQNDIYGLLFMETKEEKAELSENALLIVNAFSELTALALANIRLRENLRYQSIRDPLTALYNRRYLEDFLLKQIYQAERAESSLAVLLLDLDHFKKINDTYGHDAGDIALKEVGRVLENSIRMGDIASRYGGEEFIIIFYKTHLDAAKKRAESIRRDISMLSVKYGTEQVGPLTISIGISIYPQHGSTPEKLIEAADKALYSAKNLGRDRIVVYGEKEKSKVTDLTKTIDKPS